MSRYRDDMRDSWWETVRRLRRNEPVFVAPEEYRPDCRGALRAAQEAAQRVPDDQEGGSQGTRPFGPHDGDEGPLMRGAGLVEGGKGWPPNEEEG